MARREALLRPVQNSPALLDEKWLSATVASWWTRQGVGGQTSGSGQMFMGSTATDWVTYNLYSPTTYSLQQIGAFVVPFRVSGGSGEFAIAVCNAQDQASPLDTSTGIGLAFGTVAVNDNHFHGDTAKAENLMAGATGVKSIYYSSVIVPRPSGGAWVFLSGGVFGTWPTCTLMHVRNAPTITTPTLGLISKSGLTQFLRTRLIRAGKVPAAFKTQYGLANMADTFSSGSMVSRTPEVQASGVTGTWSTTGTLSITGGKLRLAASAQATTAAGPLGAASRIFEMDVTDLGGATGPSADIWVRVAASSAYLRINRSQTQIFKNVSGVDTQIASSASFHLTSGATTHVALIDTGSYLVALVDNVLACAVADSTNSGGLNGGVRNSGTVNVDVANFAAWPGTYTFPTNWRAGVPATPAGVGSAVASDAFAGTVGASPSTTWNNGTGWTQRSGTWKLDGSGALELNAAGDSGIITFDAGTPDVECQVDLVLSSVKPTNSTKEWANGGILRYDPVTGNYIFWRYLYQCIPTSIASTSAANPSVITANGHGYSNGNSIVIENCTDSALNGTWTVANATANTFTVGVAGAGSSGSGTTALASGGPESCEIEQWEVVAGVGKLIDYYNFGTLPAAGSTRTIKFACKGADVAITDMTLAELTHQGTTSILTGNHHGLSIVGGGLTFVGQPKWKNFSYKLT